MKEQLIVLFSILTTLTISAQEVVSTQGDSYTGSGVQVDFTVGEVIINTAITSTGSRTLTQGFHQSKWSVVGIREHVLDYEAIIFPNPTEELLNIQASLFEDISYLLYDAQGKLVRKEKLSAELTAIQLHELAAGFLFI